MLVELRRGSLVESFHRVNAVIVGPQGPLITWGDGQRPVIARSALKFIQALPLLRTGAADRYNLSDEELILACASHSGEPAHVEAIERWLARLGLDSHTLECGPDLPLGAESLADHHRLGASPSPLLNCCSGKHAGFLTVARHLGIDPGGYIEPTHPVQLLVTEAVEEMTGWSAADQKPGRDGCGIPTFGIPLDGLANAMRRLVSPGELDESTSEAARRLVAAAPGREFWISGHGRHEVTLGQAASEPLLVKTGAEGVFMAGLPSRNIGIAIKVDDGAVRAAEAAISAVLADLGAIPAVADERPINNKAGDLVGSIRVDLSHDKS